MHCKENDATWEVEWVDKRKSFFDSLCCDRVCEPCMDKIEADEFADFCDAQQL